MAVAALLGLGVALAGCSSDSTSLAEVSTSVVSATPAPTSTTASVTSGTSAPSTATASNVAVTQVRQPLPAGLAADTKPLTDAYFGYWDFATKAYGDPTAGDIVARVGSVATGQAASQILSDATSLRSSNQRMVGTVTSSVKSAALSGTTGTVCASSRDLSYPVDAQGKPAVVAVPHDFIFKADLVQNGPAWRVQKLVGVQAC